MLLIVNRQFSKFLQFNNLAIWRMESQPKYATSYSQKNSNKHNLGRIWGPVRRFGKVGLLRFHHVVRTKYYLSWHNPQNDHKCNLVNQNQLISKLMCKITNAYLRGSTTGPKFDLTKKIIYHVRLLYSLYLI